MGCVYKIFKDDFVYYGSTKNFKRRMICHKCACNKKNNRYYNLKLYKIIRGNGGWDQFTKCIVEDNIETKQQWVERENYHIRTFSCKMNTIRKKTEEEIKTSRKSTDKEW